MFSALPIDQAYEQNSARIKGDGGAVGITDNPGALRRWMIAGSEIAWVIDEFESVHLYKNKSEVTLYHEQTASVQLSFTKDVHSLVATFMELENPFEEESWDLLVLDTKEVVDSAMEESVKNARRVGQKQFQ